jgi:hypothetical protein
VLQASPTSRVLATSRVPLGSRGEQVVEVEPLGVPDPGLVETVEDLRAHPATELLLALAPAAATASPRELAELAGRLDGLPLALELEVRGQPDATSRATSLGEAIDASVAALEPAGAGAFATLSVCRGGCAWSWAPALLGLDAVDALPAVEALLDHALLRVRDGRLRMLEPVREHAGRLLERSGDAAAARERHARAVLGLFADLRPGLVCATWREARARLGDEAANLAAALTWARDRGDLALEAALLYEAHVFWVEANRPRDGLSAARDAFARSDGAPPELRARLGVVLYAMALEVGDAHLARMASTATREAADRAGPGLDPELRCSAWFNGDPDLGGDLSLRRADVARGIDLARREGLGWLECVGMMWLAGIAAAQRDDDAADRALTELVRLTDERDFFGFGLLARVNRGETLVARGDHSAALQAFAEAADLAVRNDRVLQLAGVFAGASAALSGVGAHDDDAVRLAGASHRLFDDVGAVLQSHVLAAFAPWRAALFRRVPPRRAERLLDAGAAAAPEDLAGMIGAKAAQLR